MHVGDTERSFKKHCSQYFCTSCYCFMVFWIIFQKFLNTSVAQEVRNFYFLLSVLVNLVQCQGTVGGGLGGGRFNKREPIVHTHLIFLTFLS